MIGASRVSAKKKKTVSLIQRFVNKKKSRIPNRLNESDSQLKSIQRLSELNSHSNSTINNCIQILVANECSAN